MINSEATASDVQTGAETCRRRIDRHECETVIRRIARDDASMIGGGQADRVERAGFATVSGIYCRERFTEQLPSRGRHDRL